MKLTNNKNLKYTYELQNTMVIGRDAYKSSEDIIKDEILNKLYGNNTCKELNILITENTDLSDCVFAHSIINDKSVMYYDLSDSFYREPVTYNPLYGDEGYVISKMNDLILGNDFNLDNYTKELCHHTLAYSIKIIKRLYGYNATLSNLYTLLNNTGGKGKRMVLDFSKMPVDNPSMARENSDIAQWFLNDYYSGLSGERGATKTFEYCSYLRHKVNNVLHEKHPNNFLNQYCQYPIYMVEDIIIINLKSFYSLDIKTFTINSMLSDIIKDSPNIKKTIYSDLDLNLEFNYYFKTLIKNSKKLNISCFNFVQDFSTYSSDLSGYIDSFVLSDNLSINDFKYFNGFSEHNYIKQLSDHKISNLVYANDLNKAKQIISKYHKDRLRGHTLYNLNKEEKKKDDELNEIVRDTFSILRKWKSFNYFEDFSFNKTLANYIWSLDIDEAKKVKSRISSIFSIPRALEIDNLIKFENGYIYDKNYCDLERSQKIKVKEIKNLRDLRLKLNYLENLLYITEILDLRGYSCIDEINTSIFKFKILYYNKLCVDCSMTFDKIDSKFKLKKEIELKEKEEEKKKELEKSSFTLSRFDDDSNYEDFDILDLIIDDDNEDI